MRRVFKLCPRSGVRAVADDITPPYYLRLLSATTHDGHRHNTDDGIDII
jgi:hypothetical protein